MAETVRTILVTLCENQITKERREFYGRFDPVTMNRQSWKILETFKRKYEMDDSTFAQHATKKEDIS